MTRKNYLAIARLGLARTTVLVMMAIAIAACDDNASNNPDTVGNPSPPIAQNSPNGVSTPSPLSSPTSVSEPISEPITDLGILSQTADKQSLAEKQAQFTNLKVQNVVGDRTFWVTSNNNQKLFILLAPSLDEGSAEQKIVVKSGQTIELKGVLKKMPSSDGAKQQWGLSATDAGELKNQALYLFAEQIKFK